MKSGSRATFGIGKIAETNGNAMERPHEKSPIAKPIQTPQQAPKIHPKTNRCKEAPRCFSSSPLRARSTNAAMTSLGVGRPMEPPLDHVAAHQRTKRITKVARESWGMGLALNAP